MKRPHIPRTWTHDQALQVAAFLQDLIDDTWQVYGYDLAQILYDAPTPTEAQFDDEHDADPD